MTKTGKKIIRYSTCFKLQIVEEIEKNGLSIEDFRGDAFGYYTRGELPLCGTRRCTAVGNQLLFIEKLTFQAPYQVIRFNNRSELNDYLMRMYDTEWGQSTASPSLMENDGLLEGYRPNPDKEVEN